MAKEFEVKLISSGVRELLRSGAIAGECTKQASRIRDRAGDGYTQETYIAQTRAVSIVKAGSAKAYYDNLKNNTLLKAVK
jgi:hypothetical protein